ncbi:MAG TPA: 1-(5-phosphoribosyl)-5-[(5-phosphoribosylamino)methylideneamino]imidazole-4-carboxamide isomerase [Stellaceae bacterium]|nr:1-(5-phosphoribosyl)-5-[(5-phosphoribosylamino)methylideneamino]imidazole-4-carboxamide isomerase [Stellaceae bacterium]
MIVFPAIDLKEGRCVRLLRGDMAAATVFADDPAAQARRFAEAGARWLHVVDLDGAFAGESRNGAAVAAVLAATSAQVQLGGGIRSREAIAAWLGRGVARVVLGTVALSDPDLVKAACRDFPGRIVLGLDARGGRVAVEGWARTSEIPALELALRFEDAGAAAIVHTDIERDGAMEGANVAASAALARRLRTPVIVSGGVTTLADLEAVKRAQADGVAGAIIGRALYYGRIDLREALALAAAGC